MEVHRRGGFEIRNFISNSKEVLLAIPPEARANGDKDMDMESDMPYERILGLRWNPSTDTFTFNLKFHKVLQHIVEVKVPRCYSIKMAVAASVQLHIFCDASEKAFSAVGYFRVDVGGGEYHTQWPRQPKI